MNNFCLILICTTVKGKPWHFINPPLSLLQHFTDGFGTILYLIICRMLQRDVTFDIFSRFLSSIKKIAKLFRLDAFALVFIKTR